jgi:hypothetical protein
VNVEPERPRRRHWIGRPAGRVSVVVGALCLLAALMPAASAHLAYWTHEDYYYCTLPNGHICGYDGDSTGSSSFIHHSYAFQSAKNLDAVNQRVCSAIDDPDPGFYEECAVNFVRLCYIPWQHSGSPLDCHDKEGTSFTAFITNKGPNGSSPIQGHALW